MRAHATALASLFLLAATGCGSDDASPADSDAVSGSTTGGDEPGSTSTTASQPGTSSTSSTEDDTTGPGAGSGDSSSESSAGEPDDPYGIPPNCAPGAMLFNFGEAQVCAPPCDGEMCPDPGVEGLTPACAVGTAEDPTPQYCLVQCDPLDDVCPAGAECVDLGGGFGCGVGEGPGGTTGDPVGTCDDACTVLIDCEFSGPISLLTQAECVSECEANLDLLPDTCQPRLEAFLGCVENETCLTAEDDCLISGSQFQMCLL